VYTLFMASVLHGIWNRVIDDLAPPPSYAIVTNSCQSILIDYKYIFHPGSMFIHPLEMFIDLTRTMFPESLTANMSRA